VLGRAPVAFGSVAVTLRVQHFVGMFGLLRAAAIVALAATSAAAQSGRVTGVVYDSVSLRPMSGAFVQLVEVDRPAASRSVESGARGEFVFDAVAPGRYMLGFFHPTLDTLGLKPFPSVIQVAGSEVRATLAIPSRKSIVALMCGANAADAGTGVWIGTIRSAVTRQPMPDARIAAEWSTLRVLGKSVALEGFAVEDTASENGVFTFCSFRPSEYLMARAVAGSDSSGTLAFFAPNDGFLVQDVYIGPFETRRSLDPARGNSVVSLWGSGVLAGSVRRSSGQPISDARVVFGARPERRTGNDGKFNLDSLPLGTHSLEIRALGFVPSRRLVHVLEGQESVDFVLDSRETFLDTVVVVGQRVYESPRYRQFLDRRKMGMGTFLDETGPNPARGAARPVRRGLSPEGPGHLRHSDARIRRPADRDAPFLRWRLLQSDGVHRRNAHEGWRDGSRGARLPGRDPRYRGVHACRYRSGRTAVDDRLRVDRHLDGATQAPTGRPRAQTLGANHARGAVRLEESDDLSRGEARDLFR
jgi:hypothetical protein